MDPAQFVSFCPSPALFPLPTCGAHLPFTLSPQGLLHAQTNPSDCNRARRRCTYAPPRGAPCPYKSWRPSTRVLCCSFSDFVLCRHLARLAPLPCVASARAIDGHLARSTAARPKARNFGPVQTRHGPLTTVPGPARPVYRARARAGTPPQHAGRHGPARS